MKTALPKEREPLPAPTYRKAYVTFLDILGFREIVSKRVPTDIARLIDTTRFFSADDKGEQVEVGLSTISFSDSVVRIRNATEESGLFHELIDLVHAQAELSAHGILVRGGVAYGDIHHDGDRLFGPALVQAYDLESKFAVYPRIVVDPAVLNALCRGELRIHNELPWEVGYVMDLLRSGDDGVYFIDYLRAFLRELDDPPSQTADFLRRHRKVALKLAGDVGSGDALSSLALKANWLATYHNNVTTDFATESEQPELLVSTTDLPSLFRPPPYTKHEK